MKNDVKAVAVPMKKKSPPKPVNSVQFDLFKSFVTNDKSDVSNSIDIWEAIPKYFINEKQAAKLRMDNGLANPFKWEYRYKGSSYAVRIQPALLEEKNDKFKAHFPGATEELVEEALKKILTEQSQGIHSPTEYETWVKFTLKMLQKELVLRGRGRNIGEIKQAIQIMSKCHLSVYKDGKEIWSGAILQDLVTVDRNDYIEDPGAYHIARLPLFVSSAINKLQYRQFNYARLMQCKSQLSAWLYRKMINNFKQAGLKDTDYYHLAFDSIKESGLLQQGNDRESRKKVISALEELKERSVLRDYEVKEKKEGRKVVDVVYVMWASAEFVAEQKQAGKRANDNRMIGLNNGLHVDS